MSAYIGGIPLGTPIQDKTTGQITLPWQAWLTTAQTILQDCSNSGTTAQRPTSQLYVGKPYFDTTLGIPIWLKNSTPTWVNASGAAV